MKRGVVILMLAALLAPVWTRTAAAQGSRERGLGPVTLLTPRGELDVRLIRRERDLVWVDRETRSGTFIETGVPVSDIQALRYEEPRLFSLAEAARTPSQMRTVIEALDKMIVQFSPYLDLPNIPSIRALEIKASLHESLGEWDEAIAAYRELLDKDYRLEDRDTIQLRTGLAGVRAGRAEEALAMLETAEIPEDDLVLMSDVRMARARAHTAAGKPVEAVNDLMHLVVFYPFVQTNEARALSAVVPNYIELGDWSAVTRTLEALNDQYPDSPHTASAEMAVEQHRSALEEEQARALPDMPEE